MADRVTADDLDLLRSEGFWLTMTSGHADTVRRLLAERDALEAEVARLLDLVTAVEDDLGSDYLTALIEEAQP